MISGNPSPRVNFEENSASNRPKVRMFYVSAIRPRAASGV